MLKLGFVYKCWLTVIIVIIIQVYYVWNKFCILKLRVFLASFQRCYFTFVILAKLWIIMSFYKQTGFSSRNVITVRVKRICVLSIPSSRICIICWIQVCCVLSFGSNSTIIAHIMQVFLWNVKRSVKFCHVTSFHLFIGSDSGGSKWRAEVSDVQRNSSVVPILMRGKHFLELFSWQIINTSNNSFWSVGYCIYFMLESGRNFRCV